MFYRSYQPVPALSPYVQSLHLVIGLPQPGTVRELWPDSCVELVFGFGAPLFIAEQALPCEAPPVYRIAALAGPLSLFTPGPTIIVRAQLHAWGAAPLLGAASVRTAAAVHPLDDVSWMALSRAIGQALGRDDPDAAITILQQGLLARAATVAPADRALAAAQQLWLAGGQIAIRDLALWHGLSTRQLERTFGALAGIGPKRLARAIRFERVRDALWQEERGDLRSLALRYGYADQAHLTREVKAFTGRSPVQLTRALRADYALVRDLDVAFLQEAAEPHGHTRH